MFDLITATAFSQPLFISPPDFIILFAQLVLVFQRDELKELNVTSKFISCYCTPMIAKDVSYKT